MSETTSVENLDVVGKENPPNTETNEMSTAADVKVKSTKQNLEEENQESENKNREEYESSEAVEYGNRSEGVGADSSKSNEADSRKETDEVEEESEDEGIDGNEEMLDKPSRDALYEKGIQYEAKNKNKLALKCYLQCLKGLGGGTEFSYLPQCLRKVADLYFKQDELEKAIQFIQAEKMYYETALIDTSALQLKVEERKRSQEKSPDAVIDPNFTNPDTVRADEFENLARMCLEKDQAQLALEYQGKATKLRQKVYGDVHEVTKKSLDFFTVIYGEVGKQQYSESMQKLSKPTAEEAEQSETVGEDTTENDQGSPQSILRKRNKDSMQKKARLQKRVSFVEPELAREKREQEEWISKAILWVLFFFCSFLLVVIFHYIYCKIDVHSHYCATMKSDFHYYYMRFKYIVYYYTTPSTDDANIG